jgi:hypothetical protein
MIFLTSFYDPHKVRGATGASAWQVRAPPCYDYWLQEIQAIRPSGVFQWHNICVMFREELSAGPQRRDVAAYTNTNPHGMVISYAYLAGALASWQPAH